MRKLLYPLATLALAGSLAFPPLALAASGEGSNQLASLTIDSQPITVLRPQTPIDEARMETLLLAGNPIPKQKTDAKTPSETEDPEEAIPAFTLDNGPLVLRALENPGGGRIQNKKDPAPSDIVVVGGYQGRRVPLQTDAARAWQALVQAARADGIAAPAFQPISGYRSTASQQKLWNEALRTYGSEQKARAYVAKPGSSAHQSGRAIDLYLGIPNSPANIPALRKTKAYQWMKQNATRFGFYPYETEPWHWEYNPPAR